jgi:hypothetical protein
MRMDEAYQSEVVHCGFIGVIVGGPKNILFSYRSEESRQPVYL